MPCARRRTYNSLRCAISFIWFVTDVSPHGRCEPFKNVERLAPQAALILLTECSVVRPPWNGARLSGNVLEGLKIFLAPEVHTKSGQDSKLYQRVVDEIRCSHSSTQR